MHWKGEKEVSKPIEYLVFEKFRNRYEFRYRFHASDCLLERESLTVKSGQYFVIEAHKLFVPPRIGGEKCSTRS